MDMPETNQHQYEYHREQSDTEMDVIQAGRRRTIVTTARHTPTIKPMCGKKNRLDCPSNILPTKRMRRIAAAGNDSQRSCLPNLTRLLQTSHRSPNPASNTNNTVTGRSY